MNEIEDLKNNLLGLAHKVDSILKFIDKLRINDDKINEMLNMIHNLNYEKSRENNVIFNNVFPDIIRRLNNMEDRVNERKNNNIIHLMPIEDLDLTVRTIHSLRSNNIETVGDALRKRETDLLGFINFGRRSLENLREALKKHNLRIGELL